MSEYWMIGGDSCGIYGERIVYATNGFFGRGPPFGTIGIPMNVYNWFIIQFL
jgi:hypothetical protein